MNAILHRYAIFLVLVASTVCTAAPRGEIAAAFPYTNH